MKDYSIIEKTANSSYYYDEYGFLHRLNGPAYEKNTRYAEYYITGILYIEFYKLSNELLIFPEILELLPKYEIYIKQNIKDLIIEYNPKINLFYLTKKEINNLSNCIKDLIIL